jgi:hypothetical protein
MNCPLSRRFLIVPVVGAAIACWSQPTQAQFSTVTGGNRTSGTTSAGMFGQRTVGGASGLTGGQRSFTGGRQQTLGQGQQLGGGQSVLGRTLQNSTSGALSQGRFLRENRAGQFVGSDLNDVGAALGMLGGNQAGTTGLNALRQQQQLRPGNQGRQRNTQPNQGNGMGNRQQLPVYRVSREPGFQVQAPLGPSAFGARLTRLVNQSSTIRPDSPIEVEVSGRTAILRGSVASDRARVLAARLVLLEPGVDQVDNQLQVATEPQ